MADFQIWFRSDLRIPDFLLNGRRPSRSASQTSIFTFRSSCE